MVAARDLPQEHTCHKVCGEDHHARYAEGREVQPVREHYHNQEQLHDDTRHEQTESRDAVAVQPEENFWEKTCAGGRVGHLRAYERPCYPTPSE